jgi:hypothetical protein
LNQGDWHTPAFLIQDPRGDLGMFYTHIYFCSHALKMKNYCTWGFPQAPADILNRFWIHQAVAQPFQK